MNTSEIKKNWSKQEEKLKQKFATVTDNDLTFERGKNEKMSGVLQVKWGKTKEELHKNIEVL
ncbi:MAG TPA: general stress protein CsbD [Chitinophagaceae bacterium]|nr:general stress protein CsbD [Chitinophagaceae bacterium]